jgi:hypothetical protein
LLFLLMRPVHAMAAVLLVVVVDVVAAVDVAGAVPHHQALHHAKPRTKTPLLCTARRKVGVLAVLSPEFLHTPRRSSGGQSTMQGRSSTRTRAQRHLCLSLVAGGGVRPSPERRSNGRRGTGSAPPLACSVSLYDRNLPGTGGHSAGQPPWPGTRPPCEELKYGARVVAQSGVSGSCVVGRRRTAAAAAKQQRWRCLGAVRVQTLTVALK